MEHECSVFLAAKGGPLHRPGSPSALCPRCAPSRGRLLAGRSGGRRAGARSRPPGARAGARPRTRSGSHAAHAAALVGHGHVDARRATVDRRAEHDGHDPRGPARPRRRRRPPPTRQLARRPSGRRRTERRSAAPKARRAAARREAVLTRARTPRSRPAGKQAPPAPTRARSPGSPTSSRTRRRTTSARPHYSSPRADSSHSYSQAAHSSQSRHASHEVSCVEAAGARDCSRSCLLPAAARRTQPSLDCALRHPAPTRIAPAGTGPRRRSRGIWNNEPTAQPHRRRLLADNETFTDGHHGHGDVSAL